MRATAVVALLLHALPGSHGAATTFVRVPEDLAYAEAEARCTQIGAAIASIHSAAENELARTACGNLISCWLGLAETGGDAGTAAANQTWLWQDPPAGQTALPAYTNWAAGEPANPGASAHAVMMSGEWYAAAADDSAPYPLCRVPGELNFTLDHNAAQCRERCRPKNGQNKDKKCCAQPRKMSCADDAAGGKYQLVRFEGITNQEGRKPHALECDGYRDRPAYSYGCYPRERRRNQKFQSRPLDGVEVYFPTGANPG